MPGQARHDKAGGVKPAMTVPAVKLPRVTSLSDLRSRLRAAGAGPTHERRVLRLWSHALPQDSGPRAVESFLPHSLLDELPAIQAEFAALAALVSQHPAED